MLDAAIQRLIDRACYWAWSAGFAAGQTYGRESERYDPNRDPDWDEPSVPTNPYEHAAGG